MVLEASCRDGGEILLPLVDNLLGGLHSMVRFKLSCLTASDFFYFLRNFS